MFFNSIFLALDVQYNILSRHLQSRVGRVTANIQLLKSSLV